jgi:hypothetical protein
LSARYPMSRRKCPVAAALRPNGIASIIGASAIQGRLYCRLIAKSKSMRWLLGSVAILLSSVAASANTLVILFRTEQGTVLATDSKVNVVQGQITNGGLVCKMHTANNLVWATTGVVRETHGPFNLWSIADSAANSGGSLDEIVDRFLSNAVTSLREFLPRFKATNPQDYLSMTKGHYPATAIFIRQNAVRTTWFHLPDLDTPNNIEVAKRSCPGNSCPTGTLQVLMGHHETADAMIKDHPEAFNKGIVGGLNDVMEAQTLATPDDLSPPVDILQIDNSGGVRWLQKGSCN